MLQCVAVCCRVFQGVAVCCRVLQGVANHNRAADFVETFHDVLENFFCLIQKCIRMVLKFWRILMCCVAGGSPELKDLTFAGIPPQSGDFISRKSCSMCCSVLQCVAECCSVLQCFAVDMTFAGIPPQSGDFTSRESCSVCCSVLQCVAVCCSGFDSV